MSVLLVLGAPFMLTCCIQTSSKTQVPTVDVFDILQSEFCYGYMDYAYEYVYVLRYSYLSFLVCLSPP